MQYQIIVRYSEESGQDPVSLGYVSLAPGIKMVCAPLAVKHQWKIFQDKRPDTDSQFVDHLIGTGEFVSVVPSATAQQVNVPG